MSKGMKRQQALHWLNYCLETQQRFRVYKHERAVACEVNPIEEVTQIDKTIEIIEWLIKKVSK